jgi:hypothetical protein
VSQLRAVHIADTLLFNENPLALRPFEGIKLALGCLVVRRDASITNNHKMNVSQTMAYDSMIVIVLYDRYCGIPSPLVGSRRKSDHRWSFLKRRSSVHILLFSPLDDDGQSWNSDEYEAGYQARQEGTPASFTATRSWRAGWADAEWTSFMLEIASSELSICGDGGASQPRSES